MVKGNCIYEWVEGCIFRKSDKSSRCLHRVINTHRRDGEMVYLKSMLICDLRGTWKASRIRIECIPVVEYYQSSRLRYQYEGWGVGKFPSRGRKVL